MQTALIARGKEVAHSLHYLACPFLVSVATLPPWHYGQSTIIFALYFVLVAQKRVSSLRSISLYHEYVQIIQNDLSAAMGNVHKIWRR